MSTSENHATKWKLAYRVLDVPETATAEEIRTAHRELVKRWHPDRYPAESREQDDATRMTEIINRAYAEIREAPLSSQRSTRRQAYRHPTASADAPPAPPPLTRRQRERQREWSGYWIRFGCGAAFAVLVSFRIIIDAYRASPWTLAAAVLVIALFAMAAGLAGETLWRVLQSKAVEFWKRIAAGAAKRAL